MAEAISTPLTARILTSVEIAKTGIDECISSHKTMFWRINRIPNINRHIALTHIKICFPVSFLPSFDSTIPARRTSRPEQCKGFKIDTLPPLIGAPILMYNTIIISMSNGMRIVFAHLIFSMPIMTIIAPKIIITKPRRLTPVRSDKIFSLPASILTRDTAPAKKVATFTNILFGIRSYFPASKNTAQIRAMNTDERATHQGEVSPKNRAISRPVENPAPIDVPINKNATFNADNIVDYMQVALIT